MSDNRQHKLFTLETEYAEHLNPNSMGASPSTDNLVLKAHPSDWENSLMKNQSGQKLNPMKLDFSWEDHRGSRESIKILKNLPQNF